MRSTVAVVAARCIARLCSTLVGLWRRHPANTATRTDSRNRLDVMHKRDDVQRQHIIDSLDNLIFHLYTLSFFLSPTLLPLLCRVFSQFIFYKPRDVDPKLSLQLWFLLLCVSNAPSFWTHLWDGATESRAVILDFVGMGYLPSKLHLVLLDTLILSLQLLLTTISFEISLRLSSLSDPAFSAIPPSTPPIQVDHDDQYSQPRTPKLIIDLRFRHLVHHLRNPTPFVSRTDLTTLPLPNTTPSPLSMHLRAIVRRREETRRRDPSDSTVTTEDTRSMPGGMSTE